MRIPKLPFLLFCATCLPLLHCGDEATSSTSPETQPEPEPEPPKDEPKCTKLADPTMIAGFSRRTLDAAVTGPAYVAAGDLNGDSLPDLVVAAFGTVESSMTSATINLSAGTLSVYTQVGGADCWKRSEIITPRDEIYFPNQPSLVDLDKDGDLDVLLAAGFFVCRFAEARKCGALAWFENAESGWVRHDIVPNEDQFYHIGVLADMDADGTDDLVTVGEMNPGAEAKWFKGDSSSDRFEKTPRSIGEGLGSFPNVRDIDGDGDLDVASAEYFVEGGAFAWFEQTAPPSPEAPAGTFVKHIINTDAYKSIMLRFVDNLYGDGVVRAVGANHTNTTREPPDPAESAVFVFDVPEDPKELWPKKQISSGIRSRLGVGRAFQAAPGIFGAGDVDNDGDIDLAVSGDGDERTFWLEQTSPGEFATHVIEETLGQAGGTLITDLDGDGKNEVVFTGFEDNVVHIYARAE